MEGFGLSWCLIIVLQTGQARCWEIWYWLWSLVAQALYFGIDRALKLPLWEKWSGHGRGSTDDGYPGRPRRHSFDGRFGRADRSRRRSTGRERRYGRKQMAEKYGPIVYKKEFKNGRIILPSAVEPHSDRKQRGLGYTPQSVWKGFGTGEVSCQRCLSASLQWNHRCIWQMMIF